MGFRCVGVSIMCDLLLVCFSTMYRAPRTLYRFMEKSIEKGDIDGWGLGFFLSNRHGVIVKDVDLDKARKRAGKLFRESIRLIESEIIIAHFRLATRKNIYGERYAHPFKARFLGEDWIFAHNGYSNEILHYKTKGKKIHTRSDFDSPFVFEYIRDKMVEYLEENIDAGLFNAVKYAVKSLYEEYPGFYNFVLANSNVAFFNLDSKHPHNNELYMNIKRGGPVDRVIVITTVKNLTPASWITIRPKSGYRGKLLMVSEGELLSSDDI